MLCDYTYRHGGVSASYSASHPSPFKRPLNPVKTHPRCVEGKRTPGGGGSDIVHLRPAEIRLKEQAIALSPLINVEGKKSTDMCICSFILGDGHPSESEMQDCGCVGAEVEHGSLKAAVMIT